MDELNINITGIDQVLKNLTELPTDIVKVGFGTALTAAAVPIVEQLEPRIPVLTGELKESIQSVVKIDSDGKGGELQIGFKGKQGAVARWLEFGHRLVSHKPQKTVLGEVSPKPFMRPALAAAQEDAIEAFEESIKNTIEEFRK